MWLAWVCIAGRYGEEFVAKRQEKLQCWSNRIARHPVLSRCEVVNHFFLCDDAGVSNTVTFAENMANFVQLYALIESVESR